MDRFKKFLAKLQRRQRERVVHAVELIEAGKVEHLDIKPLKGMQEHFRCRIGMVRIFFVRVEGRYVVYDADFRGNAYKK